MSELSTKCSDAGAGAVVLDAFDVNFSRKHIEPSSNDCHIKLVDPTSPIVVFGNGPLQVVEGEAYFEVRVESTNEEDKALDGLTVGVMLGSPSDVIKHPPDFADEIPDSWSAGFDGCYCHDGDMSPIDWSPKELKVGDEVGVLITRNRDFCVLVNGELKATGLHKVPVGVPLYAFVNLMGRTTAVSLVPGAAPPRAEYLHDGHSIADSDAPSSQDDVGVPAHTMALSDDAEQWAQEEQAIRHRDSHRLALLRAERCLGNLSWTVGKCASTSVVPFGSVASASIVYGEMDSILAKFGIPMTVNDSMWKPRSPTMRAIQRSVAQLAVAGAAAVTGSLSTNALYAIPVVGFAAATVAGPMICASTSFAVLTRFIDDLQPIAEEFYYLQWYPLQHPWRLAYGSHGDSWSSGSMLARRHSNASSRSELWVDCRDADDKSYTF
eukprot:TRINITY_DN54838_c0_g1_i1.p1 TRINITY_DN54838_c0_g1~~TRINITY_DN54838_c0_g1_i1.p1  ORF type:complete len:437 (-),score=73.37 TRINITY_DN54838_c0_g1_i1:263-1573(-)